MFKKVSYLVLALALFVGALGFVGCDSSGDDGDSYITIPMPQDLKGAWTSTYDEEYTITDTTFTSAYAGTVGYEGTIENIRGLNGGASSGYITILLTTGTDYTQDPYVSSAGKYYVVYWQDLQSKAVDLRGCSDSAGKTSKEEAEAEYTYEGGYFNSGSPCTKP